MKLDTERPSGTRLRRALAPASRRPSVWAQLDQIELSTADVQAMLQLLKAHGRDAHILVKVSAVEQGFVQSSFQGLAERLFDGTLQSARLTYDYGGSRWLDTLFPVARGARVVRLQLSLEFDAPQHDRI